MRWVLLAILFLQDPLPKAEFIHEDRKGGADSAVSPDGQWIAFSSRQSGNPDLWIVNVKSKETRQITKNAAPDYEPRWHPDGSKIVFVSDRNGNQDVFQVDIETLKETPLASSMFNEDYPSYSADGKKIVYTSGPFTNREVMVKDLVSGEVKQITRGHRLTGAATFSPDGKKIAYHVYYKKLGEGESDLYSVDASGGEGAKITDDDIWDYKPCWSPDGQWIAFSSKRTTKTFDVWIVSPDGKTKRQITGWADSDERWPNWTSDGRIGFHRITPARGRLLQGNQVIVDVEGSISSFDAGPKLAYCANERIYVDSKEIAKGTNPVWVDGAVVYQHKGKWWKDGVETAAPDQKPGGDYRIQNEPQRVQYYLTKEPVK
jgi:TolB protein